MTALQEMRKAASEYLDNGGETVFRLAMTTALSRATGQELIELCIVIDMHLPRQAH